MFFYIFPLFLFFACNSAFEQGYLEPWRYINALLLLLILDPEVKLCSDVFTGRNVMQCNELINTR